jgi:hypothetical protein
MADGWGPISFGQLLWDPTVGLLYDPKTNAYFARAEQPTDSTIPAQKR